MLSATYRAMHNHWPISAHCYANDMLMLCRPHDESEMHYTKPLAISEHCYANNMLMLCRPRGETEKHMLAIDARETAPASVTPHIFSNTISDYTGNVLSSTPSSVFDLLDTNSF